MKSKSSWALLLLLLSGIVLGGFIGEMTAKVPGLSWLNFGESFGLNDPLILNLGILVITFGLSIRITMASIIGVIIAILIYHSCRRPFLRGHLPYRVLGETGKAECQYGKEKRKDYEGTSGFGTPL